MREMVYKNLTSGNKKRKDLFISEITEKNGIKTVTQRHSIYVINSHNKFGNPAELAQWKDKVPMIARRHIFFFKKHDTKEKKDSFVCDIVGKFYAVIKNEVYSIGFKHSFEVDFQPAQKE
ncbi:MAG: hypothetical protein HQ532_03765 [Candidatus Omnitrophica bacterium]|nr:hypothetical protein [Candidatus Omnitrophota bacterium]